MNMFLQSKQSLRLSIYSLRRCIDFSSSRDFHLTHNAYLRSVSGGRRRTAEVQDCESSSSVAGELSVCIPVKNVNDNFFGIESDEGVIVINNTESSLKNDSPKRLFSTVEQEKLVTTTFGTVRYDSQNKPKNHGQLEKDRVLINSNIDKDKINKLNQALLKRNSVKNHGLLSGSQSSSNADPQPSNRDLNPKSTSISYVDELYFPESYTKEGNNTISKIEGLPSSDHNKSNFIEESYFSDEIPVESNTENGNITSRNIGSTDKNYSLHNYEKSTKIIADHKLPSMQYTPESENSPSSSIDKSNFIEESYFSNEIDNESISKNLKYTPELESSPSLSINKSNFIEKSYFSDKIADNSVSKNVNMASEYISNIDKNHPSLIPEELTEYSRDGKAAGLYNLNEKFKKMNAVENDKRFSLEQNNPSLDEVGRCNKFISSATGLPKKNNFLFQSKEFLKESELIDSKSSRIKKLKSFPKKLNEIDSAEKLSSEEEVIKNEQKTANSKVQKEVGVENQNANKEPETAYDFVKKLRSTKKKLDPELVNGKFIQKTEQYDSKGFRVLKNQVPDLKFYTKDEILELLVKNVLYSDDDVIVLNKPYNLVMHESKTVKDPCLSQYLDDLATELDKKTYKPKLITVHRLDKETCGCLLLARNEISAQRLLSFFSQRKIIKTYWIVTTPVPEPLEGVIDMPIAEGSVDGRSRMVLHPDLPKDIPYRNHSKSGKRAVTHYKVIAESGNAALVEAKPETGIKHQIRVHFGFGLSCPILGDHKYSHLDKFAPQKLQADLLQKLHVRQSKVRHIPMHIYARSIFIPQYKDGRNLFVMAPMPLHLSKNLQKLKFRK